MQWVCRSLSHTRSPRRGGTGSNSKLCVISQSDYGSRACASRPENWQFSPGSRSLFSTEGVSFLQMSAPMQSWPSVLRKHFEFLCTRLTGLQSCSIHADYSVSLLGRPTDSAMSAHRLHNRLLRSTFRSWQRLLPCLDNTVRRRNIGMHTFSQCSWAFGSSCNTAIGSFEESMDAPYVRVKEKSNEGEGDYAICDKAMETSNINIKEKSTEDEGEYASCGESMETPYIRFKEKISEDDCDYASCGESTEMSYIRFKEKTGEGEGPYASCDESMDMSCISIEEKSGEGDYADAQDTAESSVCNSTGMNRMLTSDELVDMFFSAITDSDLVDIEQVLLQVRLRYRKTTPTSFISNLQKKMEFLKQQSMTLPALKAFLKKKKFLFATLEDVQAVHAVFKDLFGSDEKASAILAANAALIGKQVEELREMINLMAEFGIGKRVLEKSSGVLALDAHKVRDALTFLKSWGIDEACLSGMISRDWHFLQRSMKDNMRAALDYLQSVGMSKKQITHVLQKRPDILGRAVAKNLTAKHDLCQQWGLDFAMVLPIVSYQSQVRMVSQFQFFKDQGFSEEAIVKLFKIEPRVMSKSRDGLKLKLDYFLHTHKRDINEIVKFPACLLYSYKHRIVPRMTFLQNKGSLDSYCLSHVLAHSCFRFRTTFKVPDWVKLT